MQFIPAIIIGAGQAGISLSSCLQARGVEHIVLEKDRPFADWYRRRWDSFAMNTPNWLNALPGEQQAFAPSASRKEFGTLKDSHEYFEAYLGTVKPPIRVEQVEHVSADGDDWKVVTENGTYRTPNVAVCSGHASSKKIPSLANSLSADVQQLHSSEYRNPQQVQTSNVLVVGSGSSGVQICQELAACGHFKNVSLAESGNFTLPWTVAGISTYSLMRALGVFRITRGSWLGGMMFPKLEKKGDAATPPSPRYLAKKHGVQRIGRALSVDVAGIHGAKGPIVATDDLTVVWCTGFRATYEFIDPDIRDRLLDPSGFPQHHRGVANDIAGLFFVGLRFQHTFMSQDLGGVGQDAEFIADQIARRTPVSGTIPQTQLPVSTDLS